MSNEPSRVVFGMEVVQANSAAASYISVIVRGEWDMDMVDGLTGFIVRQIKRAKQRRGPLMLADVWDASDAAIEKARADG